MTLESSTIGLQPQQSRRSERAGRRVAGLLRIMASVAGMALGFAALAPIFPSAYAQAQSSSGDDAAYQKVVADPTIAGMRKYLREFPFGTHRDDVKAMLDRQSEALAWQRAKTSNNRAGLSAYLELYPDGEHAAEAKRLMAAQNSGDALHGYPDTVLNGTVSAQVTTGLEACRSLCTEKQGCAGFDHTASGNVCRLFSSVGSARGAAGSSAATRETIAGYNPAPADVPQPAEEPRQSESQPQPQIAAVPSAPETECDRLAAVMEDPQRIASVKGVGYDKIDPAAAIAACRRANERYPNVTRIQFQLGRALNRGKKYAEAMQYYLTAANAENVAAMNNIGILYRNGEGVAADSSKAISWLTKASDKGFAPSMSNIGVIFRDGMGIKKNPVKALTWFKKAAEHGYTDSIIRIGYMYYEGDGIAKDHRKAREWFSKGADLGNAESMYMMAVTYVDGAAGQPDSQEAAIWLERSLRSGFDFARDSLRNEPDTFGLELRRSLQRQLRNVGVYDGPVDGSFGPKTQAALDRIFDTN